MDFLFKNNFHSLSENRSKRKKKIKKKWIANLLYYTM